MWVRWSSNWDSEKPTTLHFLEARQLNYLNGIHVMELQVELIVTWAGAKERISVVKNWNQCAHFFLSANVGNFVQCYLFL